MGPEIISVMVLVAIFVIATWRDVNMGLLGFIASFAVGTLVLGKDADEFLSGFPVDLFLTLLGLTFLFGFALNTGVIEVIVNWCVRLVGGRVGAMPWIFFGLTAALISLGALFAVAIVTPLALTFARKHRINQFMMGLMVVHGALAGAFSPISVYGIFINDYLAGNGLESAPLTLFLAPLVFNSVFAVVVYLVLRRRPGLRAESDAASDGESVIVPAGPSAAEPDAVATGGRTVTGVDPRSGRLTRFQILTLVCLAAMAVSVLVFSWDVGLVCIVLGALLACVSPAEGKAAMARVSWSVLVLICGVLTYIEVLQDAGTVEWVSSGITAISVPLVAALLLFYLSGLVSALASSVAIIGVVMALAVPLLSSGEVHVGGFVAALAIAATIVDISPFSTNGAMLLANVHPSIRDRYYQQMVGYAGLMCLIGPGLAWLVAAVPTWVA